MISAPQSTLRPAARPAVVAFLIAGILAAVPAVAAGAPPIGTFSLPDLNATSTRFGHSISPRDYGQWISAYYFGNEG